MIFTAEDAEDAESNERRRGRRAGVDERARRELDTKVKSLEGTRSEQDEVARLTEYDFIDGSLSNDVNERRSYPPFDDGPLRLPEPVKEGRARGEMMTHRSRARDIMTTVPPLERYQLTPEKIEMVKGKLLWDEEDRIKLLGLLLENVGADRAVRLGSPEVWRAAVAALPAS